jgi:hypothetical protein
VFAQPINIGYLDLPKMDASQQNGGFAAEASTQRLVLFVFGLCLGESVRNFVYFGHTLLKFAQTRVFWNFTNNSNPIVVPARQLRLSQRFWELIALHSQPIRTQQPLNNRTTIASEP